MISYALFASLDEDLRSTDEATRTSAIAKFEKGSASKKEKAIQKLVLVAVNPIGDFKMTDYNLKQEALAERDRAADALVKIGKDAAPPLIVVLKDKDEGARVRAVDIIGRIGPAAVEAIPALTELGKESGGIQVSAARALFKIEADHQLFIPILLKSLNDGSWDTRNDAVNALGEMRTEPQTVIPALVMAAQHGLDAWKALIAFGGDSVPALEELLKHDDPSIRAYAQHALEQIGTSNATEALNKEKHEVDKEKQELDSTRQIELATWREHVGKLLINGKLKVPPIAGLLKMAGYSKNAQPNVWRSDLSLENQLGYPTLDSHYFIFTSSGKKPHIEKILVVLHDLGENESQATNLLAYAPMLLYVKGHEVDTEVFADGSRRGASGPKEFANYIPQEIESATVKEEYVVHPHKASFYVFHYGEEFTANKGMFRGNMGFDDVCALVLKGANDLQGEGKAQLVVGEGGKFHLTEIRRVYP
jgi:hypothetical protein